MLGLDLMEKLRFLPFFKLLTLILALASYNLFPELKIPEIKSQQENIYAQYHGIQAGLLQIAENNRLPKDSSKPLVFYYHADEACLDGGLSSPFARPQFIQVSSSQSLKHSISSRGPPLV